MEHLPEGQKSKEYFVKNISSPQFSEALDSLSSALSSENYEVILASFGLNYDSKKSFGVEGFISAILDKFSKKTN